MSGALHTLRRGLRRVYHGAPRPLTGNVVDPMLSGGAMSPEFKPRIATMIGLHAAADPRVADSVARSKTYDVAKHGYYWGNLDPNSTWEELLAFMERRSKGDEFTPVIYPLRIEGNVRRVPQRYMGDISLGRRLGGYEHDDYAVARDLIRQTLDRPTFEEWIQPRYNATANEARNAWDVLTGRRERDLTGDPWWMRETDKWVGDPAGFVGDADVGLIMLPPATRAELVQRYRDKLRAKGFGALSYLNTGSNEEVPAGANPWSYIVLPGAERFLGKRRGGRVQ